MLNSFSRKAAAAVAAMALAGFVSVQNVPRAHTLSSVMSIDAGARASEVAERQMVWSDVVAGPGRQPTITISESLYPNRDGVQFLINGQVDDRNSSARPNGYDATGPQEGSEYHVYPDIALQAGDTVTARWTDQNGAPRTSRVTVEPGTAPTPAPTPTPTPNPTPDGDPEGPGSAPPSSANMPTMQSIIDNAGLSNPSILKPSGTVTVTTPGAVIENLDITGNIIIRADNVTIRNVRVTGSSSTAVIRPDRDVRGTTIEHCDVNVGEANGGIGYLGYNTTVRNCRITGYADGIKVETGGLYEGNYISMTKPAGSAKHLDGIQASSDRNFTIRHNVIDGNSNRGGNAAVFVQAWNGAINQNIYNINVTENYVSGGNYTIFMEGGKDKDGSDPKQWISDAHMTGNVFIPGTERYGYARIANCTTTTTTGNITSTGQTVNPCN